MPVVDSTWRIHSQYTPEEAKTRTDALLKMIRTPSINMELEKSVEYNQIFPSPLVEDPLPVICIINGVGTGGKGTFCSLVDKFSETGAVEISTIDPVRDAAQVLLKNSVDFPSAYQSTKKTSSSEIISKKDDTYRQFLHELKDVWDQFDTSSLNYGIAEMLNVIDTHLSFVIEPSIQMYGNILDTMYSKRSLLELIHSIEYGIIPEQVGWSNESDMLKWLTDIVEINTSRLPNAIFVNIREKDKIKKYQETCYNLGFICFNLLIDGRNENELHNDADSHVHDMQYDLVIENTSDLDNLSTLAFMFATFISRANKLYGISTHDVIKTVMLDVYRSLF